MKVKRNRNESFAQRRKGKTQSIRFGYANLERQTQLTEKNESEYSEIWPESTSILMAFLYSEIIIANCIGAKKDLLRETNKNIWNKLGINLTRNVPNLCEETCLQVFYL